MRLHLVEQEIDDRVRHNDQSNLREQHFQINMATRECGAIQQCPPTGAGLSNAPEVDLFVRNKRLKRAWQCLL